MDPSHQARLVTVWTKVKSDPDFLHAEYDPSCDGGIVCRLVFYSGQTRWGEGKTREEALAAALGF